MKVLVSGASGKLGTAITEILESKEVSFSKLSRLNPAPQPTQIQDLIAMQHTHIIDVSLPEGTSALCNQLLLCDRAVLNCVKSFVIGTTGHSKELTELIEQVSKHVPVIIASNFSKGVFLFEEILRAKTTSGLCVSDLARELGFDLGLFETHHSKKKDAPSGTAVTLAKAAAIPASAVASLRVGSVIGEHTLLASAESEEIRITHTAQNRKLFALGAVSLLERMESLKVEPSLYTFRDIFSKS